MFFWNSCFFDNPTDVGNLIPGSSAFSKSTLNICQFSVHIHCWSFTWRILSINFASMRDECNYAVVWTLFCIAFLWDCNENWPLPVLWWLPSFQICWHVECSTLTASSFRIWNSSTGIPSPPLALFMVMLPKPTWLHILGCLVLSEWSYHRGYLGHEDLFCIIFLCILATS